ncbi:MAG: hypothetical protein EHM78_20325 [Myxococcaceae bacterium]|nr:MAG: hypothetical protein EHM78_20325 [Myxococcaceae bacterium]
MTSATGELANPATIALPGTSARAQARWIARAGIVGLAVATTVALRLTMVLPDVPNRHALTDDAARRVMLDVDAADALIGGDLLELAGSVVASETGSLLRLVSAPAHVLAGSAHALAVELGVSLGFTALLLLVLGLAARCVGRSAGEAVVILAISTLILLGNRDLLGQAVSGTLEMPSAVFTLASAAAWLASRASRTYRPWAVVLLGNALFHVSFQDGLMLAAAVLLVEAGEAGWSRPPSAVLSALFRGARSPVGLPLLALGLTVLLGGWWLVRTGGLSATLFGQEVSLRDARDPVALGAPLLFLFVEYAFWHERVWLAAEIPRRARFLWKWLLTPMVAWVLVPFTWRLQTLAAGAASGGDRVGPGSVQEWLLSTSRTAGEAWVPSGAPWIVVALLCGSILAAIRSSVTRRVLVSLGALVLFEVAFLTVLRHGNLQAPLIVHLAPLVALCAVAWVPAVTRTSRLVLGAGAAAALLWAVLPLWRGPELVATLSRGFESTANGDACREVARALPISRGVLVNETAPDRFATCALWVKLFARERGAQVLIREPWNRPGRHEVLLLEDGTVPTGLRSGLVPLGAQAHHGPVRGERYLAEAP